MAAKNIAKLDSTKDEIFQEPHGRKNICKRVMKFIFSHMGLFIIIIIWAIAGGFLFGLLEEHDDIKNCITGKGEEKKNIVSLTAKLLTYIQFNITSNKAELGKDNDNVANDKIEAWFQDFRNQIINNIQTNYYYGKENCSISRWDLTQALLFSLTAITTIGTTLI